ncbi:hypothetical protein GGS26DRAFT_424584 [Hypomontagnella submonticulosa]|nr:hypothetical protein GGS26DRAFT_424584 [Hypomontagnella submonticulosa]
MGNSLSAEAPWRGQRTSQKLSKPKTGNPSAAGLLSPSSALNPARPLPTARRLSLVQSSAPSDSPTLPETGPVIASSMPGSEKGSEVGQRLPWRLFRSNSSKEFFGRRRRSSSVEVSSSRQEQWSGRANSFRNGPEEAYYGQAPIQGTMSMNASRTSFNYDFSSYEAKRLLNLVEEPSREDYIAVGSENRIHISEAMRSDVRDRRPSIPEMVPTLTQTNSEISLYTPMRRRSLMTPGIATREVWVDPTPSKSRTRYSLPSTPARRDSMESMGIGAISIPPPMLGIDPIPRVLTPCEAEYKQTGAFKLGTLRITNGSPARSPSRDPNDRTKPESLEKKLVGNLADDYFGAGQAILSDSSKLQSLGIASEKIEIQAAVSYLNIPESFATSMVDSAASVRPQPSSQILPEHQAGYLARDEGLNIPQIQVTSKHTAVEDELFEDEQNEFTSTEILDVRIDTNAKSLPPRPKLIAEARNSKEIGRSDSGIASPASETSYAPLSKADSGYSSSVSLRSFSSKPPAPEKDRASDIEVEQTTADGNTERSVQASESEVASPIAIADSTALSERYDEISPPPVPMKDPHLVGLASPKASGESSPPFQQSSKLQNIQLVERTLSPGPTRNQACRTNETRHMSLQSPTSPNFNTGGSTGFRKSGKLQRFLSGARAPLIIHSSHPTGYAGIPGVPGDMQAKLQVHAGLKPIPFRKLALKSAASKETLGTILSVGSAELLQDDDISANGSNNQSKSSDWSHGTAISIGSTIVRAPSSAAPKKPIRRKPVPIRNQGSLVMQDRTGPPMVTRGSFERDSIIRITSPHGTTERTYDSMRSVRSNENSRYSVPISRLTRPNTATNHTAKDVGATDARRSYEMAQRKSHSATSLELPPVMPNVKLSKSPPPVSMRTRNMGPLRMPPPLRSRSTPPESITRSGRPPYSRKGSREGSLRNIQTPDTSMSNNSVIFRTPSRESLRGPPSARYHFEQSSIVPVGNNLYPTSPNMGAPGRAPSWEVQMDHGPSLSRQPSFDSSRRSSVSSQRSTATTGPSFYRQQQYSQSSLPLRRRSSYDDYNLVRQDSFVRDNGPYPSMSRNGQEIVTDPLSGRSMSMTQQWDQQVDQPIQKPPYVPRPHHRHRSMDQYGNPTPYRILHSYNSPAYRNVPIWR